jgi:hypothetical protein
VTDLDASDKVLQCREAMARTLNLGFVVDGEQASRIGDMYGVDGAAVALDMTLQIVREDEPEYKS